MATIDESAPPLVRPDPGIVTIPLFVSAHEGYGDASRGAREFAYNRCFGSIDTRWPGKLYAGASPITQGNVSGNGEVPIYATAWEDSSSRELIYWVQGNELLYLQTGATGTEVGANVWAATTTGAMFDDDGSGVPYLYVGFGNGTAIRRMNRARTVSTSGDALYAELLMSLNGRAYRTVIPSSGTAHSSISNCPPGSDRFTLSNWSSNQRVGFAGTDINAITSVRQSPVAVRPEGSFTSS